VKTNLVKRVLVITLTIIWVAICIVILIVGLRGVRSPGDPGVFIFYHAMRIIGFPLGLVASFLMIVAFMLVEFFSGSALSPGIQVWTMWLVVGIVGYLQWFRVVPWLVRGVLGSRKSINLTVE
jgi:hypothetical protein